MINEFHMLPQGTLELIFNIINMIFAFDGNVFVGKTSLIKKFSLLSGAAIVDEHSAFLDTNVSSHAVTAIDTATFLQSKYFDAEERRYAIAGEGERLLLDRSFVSMAAHVFALNYVSGVDIREWFLSEIEKRMEEGKIIIPDVFYYVKCDHKKIIERILKNNSKNTDSVYFDDKYLNAIDFFNKRWSDRVEGITIDTSAALPIILAETLITQISVDRQVALSSQVICGFLREVLMQEVQ